MGISASNAGCFDKDARYWIGNIESCEVPINAITLATSPLSTELWCQILQWSPSAHAAVAGCDWPSRCGAMDWRATQKRLVLRGLDISTNRTPAEMPWAGVLCVAPRPTPRDQTVTGGPTPQFRSVSTWKNSLRDWLLQWSSVTDLAFTRGTSAEGILWAMKHLAYDLLVLPSLHSVSLCHAQDALVQDVALVWQLCQRRGLELDWRATAAASEVVNAASARHAGCHVEGCPASHVSRCLGNISLTHPSLPPLPELLDLGPECRRCLADELSHFQLPPTVGGCPDGLEAEALLLSYMIPTAPRRGKSAGHSTLPYILAVNNRAEHLDQAAEFGAELSMQLPNGAHPLFGAAMFGRLESLKVLLKHCRDSALDLANTRGTTPLMVAAMHGQDSATEKLLEAGADVNLRNCDGYKAEEIALARQAAAKPQNRMLSNARKAGS